MFWFRSMHAPRGIECQRCRTAHENTCSTSQLPGRGGRHACAALPLRCLAIKYNDDPGVQHCLQISPRVCFNLPCRSRCSQLSASGRFRCSRPGCRSHTEVTSRFFFFFFYCGLFLSNQTNHSRYLQVGCVQQSRRTEKHTHNKFGQTGQFKYKCITFLLWEGRRMKHTETGNLLYVPWIPVFIGMRLKKTHRYTCIKTCGGEPADRIWLCVVTYVSV